MQDAPHIAEDEIVAVGKRVQALDEKRAGRGAHGFHFEVRCS